MVQSQWRMNAPRLSNDFDCNSSWPAGRVRVSLSVICPLTKRFSRKLSIRAGRLHSSAHLRSIW